MKLTEQTNERMKEKETETFRMKNHELFKWPYSRFCLLIESFTLFERCITFSPLHFLLPFFTFYLMCD